MVDLQKWLGHAKRCWPSPDRTPTGIIVRRAWDEAGLIVTIDRYLRDVSQRNEATHPPMENSEKESYCFYEISVE